jgi:hypothetical protein
MEHRAMPSPIDVTISDSDRTPDPFWLTPTSYWAPVHLPPSAWYGHTPFAAWLMDALRPSQVVELGTHFGCSCFAFAEAAKRLNHDCTISAVDTWEGDDHAGFYGEEVFDYVSGVARSDYARSVRLVRARFDEARPEFEDSSVDLLHIDGRHAYEDVSADFEGWRGAVRDGGVILFHDIAERENDFGVWRLWEELAEPGRSFAFEHAHGLGVLAVGDPQRPALRALFDADEATARRIREDFSRLGGDIERRAWLETLPAEVERLREEVAQRSAREGELVRDLAERDRELAARAAYVEELYASTSWRLTAPVRWLGGFRRPHG